MGESELEDVERDGGDFAPSEGAPALSWRLTPRNLAATTLAALAAGLSFAVSVTAILAAFPAVSDAIWPPALEYPFALHLFLIGAVVGAGCVSGGPAWLRCRVGRFRLLVFCLVGMSVWITLSGFQARYMREVVAQGSFSAAYEALYDAARRWRFDRCVGPVFSVALPVSLVVALSPADRPWTLPRGLAVWSASLLTCGAAYVASGRFGDAIHMCGHMPAAAAWDSESLVVSLDFLLWITPGLALALTAAAGLSIADRLRARQASGLPSPPA